MNLVRLVKIVIASFIIPQTSIFGFFSDSTDNRIAVVVNKYLKTEIEANLNIYLNDLKNEGYEPILKEWDLENDPAPQALKAYLKNLYLESKGLQGAVFIGDLPIPMMEAHPCLKNKFPSKAESACIAISNGYIAEMYYMDLVGKEWTVSGNYKFDNPYSPSYWNDLWDIYESLTPEELVGQLYPTPEIWTSRIVTSTLTGLFRKSEGQLVNAYLKKNHAYRTGSIVFQKQNLLYSAPEVLKNDEAFLTSEFDEARRILSSKYGPKGLKEPSPAPTYVDEFFKPLKNETYEIIYWGRHGLKESINLGSEKLTSRNLATTFVNISTAFVFPNSCWIGHYIAPRYFAGSYVFNDRFYVLGMPTATLPTFSVITNETMDKFESGSNLGLSFSKSMELPYYMRSIFLTIGAIFSSLGEEGFTQIYASNLASMNSRFILGDGTLSLQPSKFVANYENSPERYFFDIELEDIHIKNMFGDTPWDLAKENGEDIHIFNQAVKFGSAELVTFLIQNGADVNAKDANGDTPLHTITKRILSQEDDLEAVSISKILIESGADPDIKNNSGQTVNEMLNSIKK